MLFSLLFLLFNSCHKDKTPTIINGLVVNAKTNEPLEGATVTFQMKIDGLHYAYPEVATDINGKFNFETTNTNNFAIFDVFKPGYLEIGWGSVLDPIDSNLAYNQENNVQIKMAPRDGFLKFVIHNSSLDSIVYISIFSPMVYANARITSGLIWDNRMVHISPNGISLKYTGYISSEENVDVYWDNQPLPNNLSLINQHTSVYVMPNDTTKLDLSI